MQPLYVPGANGARFALLAAPAAVTRPVASVVYAAPWGEEMNKSRRMAALQTRALARAGCAVLLPDLQGCGDSPGEFADARWDAWIADLLAAADWLQRRHEAPLLWWGLRSGCLLAAAAASAREEPARCLFWQPVTSGRTVLQQFLRLRAAADMQHTEAKVTLARLKEELAAGRAVDIAGYRLSAALAGDLERATLAAPPQGGASAWLEVSTDPDAEPSPAAGIAAQAWRKAGHEVGLGVARGPAFWQTVEIEDAPELLPATTAAALSLSSRSGAERPTPTDAHH